MTRRSGRTIWAALLLGLMFAPAVYAHVSGVFGDYLAGSENPGVTERLLADLADSKAEMERLNPQLAGMREDYELKAGALKDKMGLYQAIGMDTYLQFMLEGEDALDLFAGMRLLERELEGDVRQLELLYAEYAPIQAIQDSLSLHGKLLEVIRGNLEARERTMQEAEALGSGPRRSVADYLSIGEWIGRLLTEEREIDPLTHRLDEIWTQNIGYLLELREDEERLRQRPNAFITRKTPVSPYTLEDRLLNDASPLTYYFLTDHAYVHLVRNSADLLLIGTVRKDGERVALEFEAAFLNGFAVPETVLRRLKGFQLDYARLHPAAGEFIVEQTNGAIVIQPQEYLKE
ncbi:coiled-coil domain-containing protein [Paenibacillus puerhi]|uniref:coiled-coil domain-containing protein n=1 Tax=Paenibacillus puerhi TaxID=2692622 RepID=UPI001359125C|nr:hypothetical protein [Paenibacillus puerhi]